MKNKIYPAIYRAVDGGEYLYANKDNYYSYKRKSWDKSDNCDNHENDTNITREYLPNTYGKVESKEHAEFIIELAKLHGFDSNDYTFGCDEFFYITNFFAGFCKTAAVAANRGEKLITIPLPPKQIQTATSEENEMQQIMKNNGDNLILGCEDSKCKEWPCVNDDVEYRNCKWKVASKYKNMLMLVTPDDCGFALAEIKEVEKPKTPEEELREWLQERIGYGIASGFDCEAIAHDLLHHLKITKKPQ